MNNKIYYIDGRIYVIFSESVQSTARLKALKPAANGCYLNKGANHYPTILV